jgi:Helitron helicase-like domain at N-terminus
LIETITPQRLLTAAAVVGRHEPINDEAVLALLRSVSRVGCNAPGSDAKKATFLPRLKSAIVDHGLPIVFVTINPGERYSALSLLYAGMEIDINDFVPERFPYLERMRSMLANPLAVIDYFHNTVAAITAAVIEGGMFGEGASHYGVIEYQGRGTPHIHILVDILSSQDRLITHLDLDPGRSFSRSLTKERNGGSSVLHEAPSVDRQPHL